MGCLSFFFQWTIARSFLYSFTLRVPLAQFRKESKGVSTVRFEMVDAVNVDINQCCLAILVLCKCSALNKSTYLPKGGTNSCRYLFWTISFVISLLCLSVGSFRCFSYLSTLSATFISCPLSHVCHACLGPPMVPPTSPLLLWFTFAKKENYVAQLFNSPEWDAIHFISAGISSNLKTTLVSSWCCQWLSFYRLHFCCQMTGKGPQ